MKTESGCLKPKKPQTAETSTNKPFNAKNEQREDVTTLTCSFSCFTGTLSLPLYSFSHICCETNRLYEEDAEASLRTGNKPQVKRGLWRSAVTRPERKPSIISIHHVKMMDSKEVPGMLSRQVCVSAHLHSPNNFIISWLRSLGAPSRVESAELMRSRPPQTHTHAQRERLAAF